ncbi:hypothetical protein QBC39DRAFT_265378 [Podospora conica]|nr:hypothetical protein QBC39DRAFT_265378 [Schizothecium conicum]
MATTTTPTARPRLGDLINSATRTTHTHLNKTILSRLPLALPPSTTTPDLYTTGLLHIAPIYLLFESLWLNLVSPTTPPPPPYLSPSAIALFPHDLSPSPSPPPPTPPPTCPPHIHQILTNLLPPSLPRTPSLHADLTLLLAGAPPATPLRLPPLTSPRLAAFLSHTRRSVASRPHVLLAYAWVLYMALFSGGRFILATLESAGPEFWSGSSPLSFFRFPGENNGEDEVKGAFKARLAELEAGLSEREVEQVVQEARCVFENLVLVVGELDVATATAPSSPPPLVGMAGHGRRKSSGESSDSGWVASLMPRILTGRVRDSVSLARERGMGVVRGRGKLVGEDEGLGRVDSVVPVLGEVERQVRDMVADDVEDVMPVKMVRFDTGTLRKRSQGGDGAGDPLGTRGLGMRNLVLLLGMLGMVWALGRGWWVW